jgi:8-oxo-dGTP diphosphatase
MVQVVAAILEREGLILIGQRKPEQSHPLKWEFPGGKVEAGESPQGALVRELEEELSIRARDLSEITRYQFAYPSKAPIELIFFRVGAYDGDLRNLIFHNLRWEPKEKLAQFDFVEGDRDFLRGLYNEPMAISRIDPSQNEFLAGLEARAKQANPFFRVMAHRPEALKSFVPFYGAVAGHGSVDRRLKELAYLTASIANRCAYCTASHLVGARKAGITEEEIRAIETEQDQGFAPADQALVRYARELTRTARVQDSTRDALAEHFTDEQVVELTLVVSMANFTNRFNNSLGILPEGQ